MSNEFQNRLRKHLEHETPADHPAPDVLNAYAEHALTAQEERQVTEHLALCADCRETVFLATGAVEDEAPPATLPQRTRVRWWAWAIPATAVIVVSAAIFVPTRTSQKPLQLATPPPKIAQTTPPVSTANPAAETKASALSKELSSVAEPQIRPKPTTNAVLRTGEPPKTAVVNSKVSTHAYDKTETQLDASNVSRPEGVVAGAAAQPRVMARNLADSAAAQAATVAAPAAAPAVATEAKSVNQTVNVTAQAALVQNETDLQELPKQSQTRDEARSFHAAPAMRLKKALPATAWMVNLNGQLTHLVNARWEIVNPVPGTQPEFLSVTSQGDQIWAAARNLVLYYSPNNGVTWEQQKIPAFHPGAEIVHLEFTNEVDGLVKLSDGEAFTTHDRGRNWVGVASRR